MHPNILSNKLHVVDEAMGRTGLSELRIHTQVELCLLSLARKDLKHREALREPIRGKGVINMRSSRSQKDHHMDFTGKAYRKHYQWT